MTAMFNLRAQSTDGTWDISISLRNCRRSRQFTVGSYKFGAGSTLLGGEKSRVEPRHGDILSDIKGGQYGF